MLSGIILKLKSKLTSPIEYCLPIGEESLDLNPLIGKKITLNFSGNIFCLDSGVKIKKSYGQGYSYPSFMKLAKCDMCILKPHTCHYDKGTCREPMWAEENCLKPHIVYLANSAGLKVGITRKTQVPTRWIDQGASYALALCEVKDRITSGKVEMMIKDYMNDRTDWRKMLRNDVPDIDLYDRRDFILSEIEPDLNELEAKILDEDIVELNYPVQAYPEKVKSMSFDKTSEITGILVGIKGQYLIFDNGVLNIRKHQGYDISITY